CTCASVPEGTEAATPSKSVDRILPAATSLGVFVEICGNRLASSSSSLIAHDRAVWTRPAARRKRSSFADGLDRLEPCGRRNCTAGALETGSSGRKNTAVGRFSLPTSASNWVLDG